MNYPSAIHIPEVTKVWSNHNYEVIVNPDINSKIAVIYFSGHGLYYPNDSTTFTETIIKNNRFEWKKNILSNAEKVILVRDIKKQWYLGGISNKLDNIDKLYAFLKQEISGFDAICVGSSAGGFAATLFGCLLGANRVFNFSGQFSLLHLLNNVDVSEENPVLAKYSCEESDSNYLSLINLIKKTSVPIFYFYPYYCPSDFQQAELVKKVENIYAFSFDTSGHAETCYPINFLDLFSLSLTELYNLHEKFSKKPINPLNFSIRVSGFFKTYSFQLSSKIKSQLKIYFFPVLRLLKL